MHVRSIFISDVHLGTRGCQADRLLDFLRDYESENLFLIGRNGMHRYNNQDHSMLAAMVAVDHLLAGRSDKANVWDVNTEEEYHESRSPVSQASEGRRQAA